MDCCEGDFCNRGESGGSGAEAADLSVWLLGFAAILMALYQKFLNWFENLSVVNEVHWRYYVLAAALFKKWTSKPYDVRRGGKEECEGTGRGGKWEK